MIGIGTSRGTRRAIGVTPTGVEIGIDIKIAQLGISTDYGGGIVVGIGGQKIVWGREGGKIHYRVAGLEVLVEARDCVVVETRKIAGQVVGVHTYPDPGCKLPPYPPKPPSPKPTPTPAPGGGIDLPNTDEMGWVIFNMEEKYYFGVKLQYIKLITRTASDIQEKDRIASKLPFKIISTSNLGSEGNYTINKGISTHIAQTYFTAYNQPGIGGLAAQAVQPFPVNVYSWWYVAGFYGKVGDIKKFIDLAAKNNDANIASLPAKNTSVSGGSHTGGLSHYYFIPTQFIPLKNKVISLPPPPAGNQPPMPDRCCEALKADIEDIKEVLAVEAILKKKVEIPGELMEIPTEDNPKPKPEIILNYAQMANAILLTINRYGIDAPIKVELEDTDTTKKGQQNDELTYNSGGVALQAILELLWEIKGDSASRLKIQVRIAYAVTRTLKIVAGVGESMRTALKMLGLPFRYDKKKLPLEFNLAAAKRGKGFGKDTGRKGTSSTESELEALLPGLLEETEYDVPTPFFDAADEDIRELLVKILIAVKSLPSK